MNPQTVVTTAVPGDPEQVRRIAALLAAVQVRAQEVESRLRSVESGIGPQMWRGRAADGFTVLLAATGPDLTNLATSYGTAARALEVYATELSAAQDTARAAQAETAAAAESRNRATAERDAARTDADRHGTTAADAQLRMDAVAAQDAELQRTDALRRESSAAAAVEQAERSMQAAQQKADEAADRRNAAAARSVRELDDAGSADIATRGLAQGSASSGALSGTPDGTIDLLESVVTSFILNVRNDLRDKWHFNATDFANGLVGGYFGAYRQVLREEAASQRGAAQRARDHYLGTRGGDPRARQLTEWEHEAARKAREVERAAAKAHRLPGHIIAGKIPVIGVVITAAGVAYDIHNGKPPGKAVISGVASIGGGLLFGALVSGPIGWVALGGVGVSLLVGAAADTGYNFLPQDVQNAISNGVEAVGNGIAEGAASVWEAIF